MRKYFAVLAMALALSACSSTGSGVKPYPLDTCLVSGTKLGSMGDPLVVVYGDQEIKFCCPPCKDEFDKDPAKFLNMLPK
jgi:YHS domain-containing protein